VRAASRTPGIDRWRWITALRMDGVASCVARSRGHDSWPRSAPTCAWSRFGAQCNYVARICPSGKDFFAQSRRPPHPVRSPQCR